MKFQERSYNSKVMRPKPLVHRDESVGLILMMTPWGSQEACQRVMDHVIQHLLIAKQDAELTTAFQNILSLSDEANDLRVATLMANDFIFRGINTEKYNLVVETLFLSVNSRHVAWCQMGCPHLFLKKHNQTAQPVSFNPETKKEMSEFPMPMQFLGSEPTVAPRCGDLYLDKSDELIMLSSSTVPPAIWTLESSQGLEAWTQSLVDGYELQPFWLSRLELE